VIEYNHIRFGSTNQAHQIYIPFAKSFDLGLPLKRLCTNHEIS
jgi:hypothetical protein